MIFFRLFSTVTLLLLPAVSPTSNVVQKLSKLVLKPAEGEARNHTAKEHWERHPGASQDGTVMNPSKPDGHSHKHTKASMLNPSNQCMHAS